MTLQEAELKLTDLNNKIAELLSERESVIKEWNAAFNSENPVSAWLKALRISVISFT